MATLALMMARGEAQGDSGEDSRRSLLTGALAGLSAGADPSWRGRHAHGAAACLALYPDALELSVGAEPELASLEQECDTGQLPASLSDLAHLSVHGPMKQLSGQWSDLAGRLEALPLPVAGFVFHPDTLSASALPKLSLVLGPRLWLENMDCRKQTARTAAEMETFFAAAPQAGLVLDVAHVWSIDPSLALGHELLDAHLPRLREVHVSGIESDGKHRLTHRSDLERYRPLLDRCNHVPWILETLPSGA